MLLGLAEEPGERNLGRGLERLAAEHEHQMLVKRIDDASRSLLVQMLREVHSRYLRTKRPAQPACIHHRGSLRISGRAL